MQAINAAHLRLVLVSTESLERLMQRKLDLINQSLHFQLDELEGVDDDEDSDEDWNDEDWNDEDDERVEQRPELPPAVSKAIRFLASVRNSLLHDPSINELKDESGYRKAVQFVRLHLLTLSDRIAESLVDAARPNVDFSAKRIEALARVLPYCKSMERSLELRFDATGRGLSSKLNSIVEANGDLFSDAVIEVIRDCSEVRNGLLYEEEFEPPSAFDERYAAVESCLATWSQRDFAGQRRRDERRRAWAEFVRRLPSFMVRAACVLAAIAIAFTYLYRARESRRITTYRREWEIGERLLLRDHSDAVAIQVTVGPAARYAAMVTVPKDGGETRALELWEVGRGLRWTLPMRPHVGRRLSIGFCDVDFDDDGGAILATVGGSTRLLSVDDGRLLKEIGVDGQGAPRGLLAARFVGRDEIVTVGNRIEVWSRRGELIRSTTASWIEDASGGSPSCVDVSSTGAVALGIDEIRRVSDSLERVAGHSLVWIDPNGAVAGPYQLREGVSDLQFNRSGDRLAYCYDGGIGVVDWNAFPRLQTGGGASREYDAVATVRDAEYLFGLRKYEALDVLTESPSHSRRSREQIAGDTSYLVDFSVDEESQTIVLRFPDRTELRRLTFSEFEDGRIERPN